MGSAIPSRTDMSKHSEVGQRTHLELVDSNHRAEDGCCGTSIQPKMDQVLLQLVVVRNLQHER